MKIESIVILVKKMSKTIKIGQSRYISQIIVLAMIIIHDARHVSNMYVC